MPPQEYGQNFRVHIVKMIDNHKTKLEKDPDHIQFICSVDDDQYKDIMSYNDIISHITKQEDENIVWKFKRIVAHEGPLNYSHTNYKVSLYNVMIEWETGENTTKPLSIIVSHYPDTWALYDDEKKITTGGMETIPINSKA